MKSKTKLVRYLLKVRKKFVKLWALSPKFISRFVLNYFRNGTTYFAFGLRYLALQRLAKSCGEKVVIFPGVFLKNIHRLEIGTNVAIHEMSYIDAYGGIKIGNDVAISHGVSIISFDHDINKDKLNFKNCPPIIGQIILENNIWVGAGVRILKNVLIEKNSIIAAGSLVNKSCGQNTILAGVPAKVIKKII